MTQLYVIYKKPTLSLFFFIFRILVLVFIYFWLYQVLATAQSFLQL